MSGDQIAVVALVVAAFLGGWFARGSRPAREQEAPDPEPLLSEVNGLLDRAVEASRATLDSPGGAGSPAALSQLQASLAELERVDERVAALLGEDEPAYASFELALNELTALARGLAAGGLTDVQRRGPLQQRAAAAGRARAQYGRLLAERS